ncbi:unnamed protein product [marine sediment metagenome]|uniref:Methyltransferase type 11 domain-containing protein n=1 Tax=marine sediment metagenome TaxID=412755 RepID=X1LP50_9ZZZZ
MKGMQVLDKKVFEEIRIICKEQGKRDPDNAFHVISNLNWYRYEKQIKSALYFLPSAGKVLDVGCGWGQTTVMLAASCPSLQVIGVDLVKAESWTRLKQYGAQFVVCNALALPFTNEFDVVISFGAVEHTGDEGRFLKQISKVLKAGGYNIIFNLPNNYALSEAVARILGMWHHERRYTRRRITELLLAAGFSIIKVDREGIVPAQVDRLSKKVGNLFNRYYLQLDKLDSWLVRTPFACLSENWTIYAQKSRG